MNPIETEESIRTLQMMGLETRGNPKPVIQSPSASPEFIAHDWCGFNDRHGRFTHCPSGDILVCQAWMDQLAWDKAQLEWFRKWDGSLVVHKCPSGPYRETGDSMGTVAEIIERLRQRLPQKCPTCDGDRRGVWRAVGCTTLGRYVECPTCHGKPLPSADTAGLGPTTSRQPCPAMTDSHHVR